MAGGGGICGGGGRALEGLPGGGLGADSRGCGGLAGEPAPLTRSDPVVGVARDECHRRGLDHAVVLADHAALAALLVLDHDRPLQDRPNPNLFAVDDRVETAADLVIGWWDDAG